MGWLVGYRTYLATFTIIAHQVLKLVGVDLPSENLSITLDTVMAVVIAVLKMSYKKKEEEGRIV